MTTPRLSAASTTRADTRRRGNGAVPTSQPALPAMIPLADVSNMRMIAKLGQRPSKACSFCRRSHHIVESMISATRVRRTSQRIAGVGVPVKERLARGRLGEKAL